MTRSSAASTAATAPEKGTARHWRAGQEGRAGRRRPGIGQAEPVRPALRRHPRRLPRPRGHGPGPGRDQSGATSPARPSAPAAPRVTPGFVTGACRQLFRTGKSFRMSQSDLLAGPSATASATASKPACRPGWPSVAGPKTAPAGRPAGSSAPPAGTAPQGSRPDRTSSPPPAPCPATCARPCGPRLPARHRTPAASRPPDFVTRHCPPDFVTRHCRPEQAGAPAPAAAPLPPPLRARRPRRHPAPPPVSTLPARIRAVRPGPSLAGISPRQPPAALRAPPRGQYRNAPAPLATAHHAEIGQRPAGAARNLSQPGFRRADLSRAGYRVLSGAVAEPERAGDKREA